MKKMSEPILFFGSGPVAAASLELLSTDFNIEAVITKPRPLHHRGEVPVLDLATKLNLPIYTATTRRTLDEVISSHNFNSRLGVLIDFGIIVSQLVINSFPLGIINSHFSLLPEWRGADPITFAILSGQERTGVSLMLLTEGLDEGPLLSQAPYDMSPEITTPQLTSDLIQLSHQSLVYCLPLYYQGQMQPVPQENSNLASSTIPTYSHKLSKKDGLIDWHKPASQLEREVRAFQEWPKSYTSFNNLEAIITKAHIVNYQGQPGQRIILDKLPVIYCSENALAIDRIKPSGKKEMDGQAFLAGYRQLFTS